jgi:hypothetical protein
MISPKELTKGCIILTRSGTKTNSLVRSIVESWNEYYVTLISERQVRYEDCYPYDKKEIKP